MSVGHSSTKKPPEQARQRPPGDPPGYAAKTALNGSEKPSGAAGIEDGQIGASLGSIANTSTPPLSEQSISRYVNRLDDCSSDRSRRYFLRSVSASLLPDRRVALCGRVRVNSMSPVSVTYSNEKQRASYQNLQTCGSIHVDPVCAAKITEERRQVLTVALAQSDLFAVLITLTQQHQLTDRLADLRDMHMQALGRFKAGKSFAKFKQRVGWVADVRGLETTIGMQFGWHLHSHILALATEKPDIEEWFDYLAPRWSRMVGKEGGYASMAYGVKITFHDAVAEYIAKFQDGAALRRSYDPDGWTLAHEIAKHNVKQARTQKGLTPFGLLAVYSEMEPGSPEALYLAARWREFDAAMFRHKQLVTSANFFDVLPVDGWRDDEVIAAEVDEIDRLLGCLNQSAWGYIHYHRANGELLAACADGQPSSLWSFLARIGIPPAVIADCKATMESATGEG